MMMMLYLGIEPRALPVVNCLEGEYFAIKLVQRLVCAPNHFGRQGFIMKPETQQMSPYQQLILFQEPNKFNNCNSTSNFQFQCFNFSMF